MELANQVLQPLATYTSLPIDQVRLLISFYLVSPIGWVQWAFIKGRLARHLYSLIFGSLLCTVCFGFDSLLTFLGFSLITFAILRTVPRTYLGISVFIYAFSLVFAIQIKRMIYPGHRWTIDTGGLYMIAALKFTSLAYCLQDSLKARITPKFVTPEQRKHIVDQLPSLLEFYSFMVYYPTFLIGPTIEFSSYLKFIEEKAQFASVPPPFKESLKRMGQAALMMFPIILVGQVHYDYVLSDEFYQKPFLYKLGAFWVFGALFRLRFYLAWKFSEAGAIASGFGYAGQKSTGEDWDNVLGIRIRNFELGSSVKICYDNWNVSVGDWLRRYSYERIIQANGSTPSWKSIAQHSTFVLSAVWHGFQPGYLIFFLNASILGEVNKMIYVTDFTWLPAYRLLQITASAFNTIILNHLALSFIFLNVDRCLQAFASIDYVLIIVMYSLWVVFKFKGRPKTKLAKTT